MVRAACGRSLRVGVPSWLLAATIYRLTTVESVREARGGAITLSRTQAPGMWVSAICVRHSEMKFVEWRIAIAVMSECDVQERKRASVVS